MKALRWTALTAVGYFGLAKLALLLAVPPGYASPVWPAAGVALALAVVYGRRPLLGIWLGSFCANWLTTLDLNSLHWTFVSVSLAAGIGAGAALQAWAGSVLVRRMLRNKLELTALKDVLIFLFWGGAVGCLVNCTAGTALLVTAGIVPPQSAWVNWTTWWVGDALGVFLFAPLAMAWIGVPQPLWRMRRMRLVSPMMAIFIAIGGIFVFSSKEENQRVQRAFQNTMEGFETSLQNVIDDYKDEVYEVKDLFDSSDSVSRKHFGTFTKRAFELHPGIRAIEWVPFVSHEDIPDLVQSAREDGLASFELKELTPDGTLIPAKRRDHHLPITYLEPIQGNEAALGLDLYFSEARSAYLLKARDTATATASFIEKLAQDTESSYAFLVSVPIYRSASNPQTVEDRRDQFRGCAVIIFRVRDLVAEAAAPDLFKHAHVTISNVTDPADRHVIFASQSGRATAADPMARTARIRAFDQDWIVDSYPTLEFMTANRNWSVWFILIACFLFASVLTTFLLTTTGQAIEVSRLVNEKTVQLNEAQAVLEKQVRTKDLMAKDVAEQARKLQEQKEALLNVLEDSEFARKRAEAAEANMQEAMKVKSEFISVVSHELRTPLTVIKESVALVEDGSAGTLNDDQRDFLDTAKRNVDRLARLINDVLDFQKLEGGYLEFHKTANDLGQLIAECAKDFETVAEKKGLDLKIRLDWSPAPFVFDKDRITQVLANLLSNAFKFTEQGSVEVRLFRTNDGRARVNVTDNGIGIKEEDKVRLFQAFSQLSTGVSRKTGSSGLGLAVSRKIIEQHGGSIGVDSAPGKGSTFYFVLPVNQPTFAGGRHGNA